ncbi:DUF2963 domain-containing protein [Candidatus Phytoplasma pini]|uniref:DUF2963 domain-containing protein n=1 Tax=Candidatus Phytoplasma pini TaxID=267362 RepID=A0A559KJ04_9MOLU|nr:DUF2963 domain-containing protein [Candidatus Phytoplasma pini]TVY12112.1 hypothetical protein MDPP_00349 [Candidatus Phytoplasma pini]
MENQKDSPFKRRMILFGFIIATLLLLFFLTKVIKKDCKPSLNSNQPPHVSTLEEVQKELADTQKRLNAFYKKKTFYHDDDKKKINYILTYNPQTGHNVHKAHYNLDGVTVGEEDFYDTIGHLSKQIFYQDDGIAKDYIMEYDVNTRNKIKLTVYCADGETINYIKKYDPNTGEEIK